MKMPIKYIGRTTDFKGKTLWEILGNLKNFGVGRVVVRSMFERYPEPSYMKIKKVETVPNEDVRKVRVWVEKTFRGQTNKKLVEMYSTTYKADHRLIPKDEEAAYCRLNEKVEQKQEKIFPRTVNFPPLLRELIVRDKQAKGEIVIDEPTYNLKFRQGRENHVRIAKECETPNVEIVCGLGTPASPELYKGINL